MSELLNTLNRTDLFCINGMTTELGHKTKRTKLKELKDCEDWLRKSNENSIDFILDNDETINIK
tara:strand:- start:695 stop:886 length:192 start_codon:yes stop_codon:yes gene_type:complete